MERSYKEAINLLRSRLHHRKLNIPNNYFMNEWLETIGCKDPDILNPLHITGTKGKGSTATFTESLLRNHFDRHSQPFKTGLYTSPHVIDERDRIRINFEPVSEELFTSAFFEIWEKLVSNCDDEEHKPGYLQLLALLSVRIFALEAVDVAIYEVHAGGRKDATNIFEKPIACGITEIGLDHARLLGPDIASIVWHKSGIMKQGRPVYSVAQDATTSDMLRVAAGRVGSSLEFVQVPKQLPDDPSLSELVQRRNFSLAVKLAEAYLSRLGRKLSPGDISLGVQAKLPGRFQQIRSGSFNWFLDSAHNYLSLPIALSWFKSKCKGPNTATTVVEGSNRRVLIFGHVSDRDTKQLINGIIDSCTINNIRFDQLILTSYHRYDDIAPYSIVCDQLNYWRSQQPDIALLPAATTEDAISMARNLQEPCPDAEFEVLITGSTHLVGEALRILNRA